MPDTEKVPPDDPLAKVQHGDPLVCISDWVRAGRPNVDTCKAPDPLGVGLTCTRYGGHPGQHIAEDNAVVAATWPAAVTA